MGHLLFKVTDTFSFDNVGLVVTGDVNTEDVHLKAGDQIELRRPDGSLLGSEVASIPRPRPNYPDQPFSFALPQGLKKKDVPIGTEVWSRDV